MGRRRAGGKADDGSAGRGWAGSATCAECRSRRVVRLVGRAAHRRGQGPSGTRALDAAQPVAQRPPRLLSACHDVKARYWVWMGTGRGAPRTRRTGNVVIRDVLRRHNTYNGQLYFQRTASTEELGRLERNRESLAVSPHYYSTCTPPTIAQQQPIGLHQPLRCRARKP